MSISHVYSTPGCVQCKMTMKELDRLQISYNVVDLLEDDAAMVRIKDLGFMQAPVVEVGDDRWSGFQPAKIRAIIQ